MHWAQIIESYVGTEHPPSLNSVTPILTSSGTIPDLCALERFTRWKTSATPSVFTLSSSACMQMSVPVRPTPSL